MSKIEQGKFVRLSEVPPTDEFVCTYGGNFAEALEIDVHQVNKFLDIASLDGRVLFQESKVRRPQPVPEGINPDGSVTGRGSLRWGQKIEGYVENKKQNPYFQVEPDEAGWVISVNGGLIQEDLTKRGLGGREMIRPFASKFNYYTSVGLREALLKDKFTTSGDPKLRGRLVGTLFYIWIATPGPGIGWNVLSWSTLASLLFLDNYLFHLENEDEFRKLKRSGNQGRIFPWNRRTVKNRLEIFAPPLELDRTMLAYGYLDWKKYTGNPLVRAAD